MKKEIQTLEEFRKWARVRMVLMDTNNMKLAKQMDIAYPRISEALHGKPSGKKHVVPLIHALGGDINNFKGIL